MSHQPFKPRNLGRRLRPSLSTVVVSVVLFLVVWYFFFPLVFHIIGFIAKLIIVSAVVALIVAFWKLRRLGR